MRKLKHLTTTKILLICQLAEISASSPRHSPQDYIRPHTDNYEQLDALMTRNISPDHLALIRQIQTLSQEAMIELAAVAWFGRGDAPLDQVMDHSLKSYCPTLPYYLADMPQLANHLQTGLNKR